VSARARRLRRARPCYTCGFVARHYVANGGADGKGDPCSCRACLRMPPAWRSELREAWTRKLGDRAYHNRWEKRWGRPLDTSPIAPCELDAYAWPGGYQIMYYIGGDPVCPSCIMGVLRGHTVTDDCEILRDIFYEGSPETCSECGEEIESAYGDPDAPDEDGDEEPDPADPEQHNCARDGCPVGVGCDLTGIYPGAR
jgi:hypothetical protein